MPTLRIMKKGRDFCDFCKNVKIQLAETVQGDSRKIILKLSLQEHVQLGVLSVITTKMLKRITKSSLCSLRFRSCGEGTSANANGAA